MSFPIQKDSRKRLSAPFTATVFVLLLGTLGGCTTVLTQTSDKPLESDPGSRTLGAVIDDQGIETTATVNIRKTDPALEEANIVVTSYNGVVLLSGQAPNEDLRTRAAQVAASVKNVRRVYNELIVAPNSEFAVRSSDTLLTAKVKTRLLATKGIKDSRVKVVTENGTVFLMGLVTHAEGDIAGKITQETGGVQKVVRMFEYVDG